MKRVEFTLSMPGRASWDGNWSGAGKRYAIVKSLPNARVLELFGERGKASWSHAFGDGWVALVEARVVPTGERLPRKSAGFLGYDWMVVNILRYGRTRVPTEPARDVDGAR